MTDFTKEAIKEAFKKLLAEKPVDKITVKEICNSCGVHKNTFYYHFRDIPQLIEVILIEYADDFIAKYPDVSSLEDCLSAVILFLQQNNLIIKHLSSTNNMYLLSKYLWNICEHVTKEYIDIIIPASAMEENERGLLIHSIKCELFGYASDWLMNGKIDERYYNVRKMLELKKEALQYIDLQI